MKKTLILSLLLFVGSAVAGYATDAESLWLEKCKKCHGIDGKGETKMGKKLHIEDYTTAEAQAKFTDEEAFKAVKEGLKDENGKTRMKAIKNLSDDDIDALVQYVRGLQK